MAFLEIAEKLSDQVVDGTITEELHNTLFEDITDTNVWQEINIDCAMPNSKFYAVEITAGLKLRKIKEKHQKKNDKTYLIIRITNGDIANYR